MDLYLIDRGNNKWCVHDRDNLDEGESAHDEDAGRHEGALEYLGDTKYRLTYRDGKNDLTSETFFAPNVDDAMPVVRGMLSAASDARKANDVKPNDRGPQGELLGTAVMSHLEALFKTNGDLVLSIRDDRLLAQYISLHVKSIAILAKAAAKQNEVEAMFDKLREMMSSTFAELDAAKGGLPDALKAIISKMLGIPSDAEVHAVAVSGDELHDIFNRVRAGDDSDSDDDEPEGHRH